MSDTRKDFTGRWIARGLTPTQADNLWEQTTQRGKPKKPSIDEDHLNRQRNWSTKTFGPGHRTGGVIEHIRKELDEIEGNPLDVDEWVDVIILAFDGAWRAGYEPREIIAAIKAKQAKNEARSWPDWRTQSEDRAIEHVR